MTASLVIVAVVMSVMSVSIGVVNVSRRRTAEIHAGVRIREAEAAIAAMPDPTAWFKSVLKRRLLVHTTTGKSFDGLLAEVVPDGIVLQQAKMLNGADGVPLVGGVFVPREQVLFTQLVD